MNNSENTPRMTFSEFLRRCVSDVLDADVVFVAKPVDSSSLADEEWESCIARGEPVTNQCLACSGEQPDKCEDVENARND